MRLKDESLRWIKQAESDFDSLNYLFSIKKYDLVCFLSQQVAEKALKSFLYYHGEEILFSHSIFKLCEMASKYDKEFNELKKEIKNLDRYYVEARYPNALEEVIPAEFFDESDAKNAINMAEKALITVKNKLK